MPWHSIEDNGACGLPWSAMLAADTPFDPYTAWLDALLAPAGALGATLPALIELDAPCDAAALELLKALGWTAGAHPAGAGSRFVTALAESPAALARLHAHLAQPSATGPRVLRYELGVGYENSDMPERAAGTAPMLRDDDGTPLAPLPGNFIAFIDHGCAFAHRRFIDPASGRTRVAALWNQQDDPPAAAGRARLAWTRPEGFLWGRHVERPALARYLDDFGALRTGEDEAACYAASGYAAIRQHVTHGTHVMDVATRNTPADMAPGDAPDDVPAHDIVFVQLPRRVDGRQVAGLLRCHVFDALQYVAARLGNDRKAVVNLSYGGYCGPHDGSALVDHAIGDLLARVRRRGSTLTLVVPAGNALDQALHAEVKLPPLGRDVLEWRNHPDDPTDSFVELWLPAGADVEVELTSPEGSVSPGLRPGSACVLDGGRAVAVLARRVCQSAEGTMLLLAVGPTVARAGRRAAPYGRWRLALHNRSDQDTATLHAWCERDDPVFGTVAGPRQARFGSHVAERASLNSLAHAPGAVVVGGYLRHPEAPPCAHAPAHAGPIASYSGTGPGRGGPVPATPHYLAPSEWSFVQPGLAAGGVLGDGVERLDGTSVAAAWATRCIVAAGFALPAVDATPGSTQPRHNGVLHPDATQRVPRLG